MDKSPEKYANVSSLAERLELGELVYFPVCPFRLPAGENLAFLRSRRARASRVIEFDPLDSTVRGQGQVKHDDSQRLAVLLQSFSETATAWLAGHVPEYAGSWELDRATLCTQEEAIRSLRLGAGERNDLLHIDNDSARPARGRRLLRLCININPTEECVWVTSAKFADLLRRYQIENRVPALTADGWRQPPSGLQRLLQRDWSGRSAYDAFMLKFQEFLRGDDELQERSPKRFWRFAPGSAWLLFGDGLSHAALRGQFALEHSYFVPQHALAVPEASPLQQLVALRHANNLRRAG
jgi:hypothetical protein